MPDSCKQCALGMTSPTTVEELLKWHFSLRLNRKTIIRTLILAMSSFVRLCGYT